MAGDTNGLLTLKQLVDKTEEIVNKVNKIITTEPSIILYVGNGISPEKLHSDKLPKNFIYNYQKTYPKEYQESVLNNAEKTLKSLRFNNKDIENVDMEKFIIRLNKYLELKRKFIYFVKESCCLAKPTETHFSLYCFCILLNALRAVHLGIKNNENGLEKIPQLNPVIKLFTSNYDNLIEKAFLFRNNNEYKILWKNRIGLENKKICDNFSNNIDFIPLIPSFKSYIDENSELTGMLPIIPIHNSIRTTKCEQCGEELMSEIIGMGEQKCIYCGFDIPDIIIPTEEKKAKEYLYNLFFDEIKDADIIIFIGYGFKDFYINGQLNDILNSKKNKLIINFCHIPMSQVAGISESIKKHDLIDICFDLPYSLDYSNYLISKKLKDKIDETKQKNNLDGLYEGWKTIWEEYEKENIKRDN